MSRQAPNIISLSTLFFFTALSAFSSAQDPLIGSPTTTTTAPPSATTSGIPQSLGYTGSDQNTGSGSSISNYYFIIIGVAIIVVLVATWIIVRRRQRRSASGPDGNARDSRRWPMPMPRWRATRVEPRLEEGLDERGEAPPPYIPGEQDPPPPGFEVVAPDASIPLQSLGKPPDYDGNSSEEDLDLTRPNPTYNPNARFQSMSPRMDRQFSSENTLGPSDTRATDSTEMRSVEPSDPNSEMRGNHTEMGEHIEIGVGDVSRTGEEAPLPAAGMENSNMMQAEQEETMSAARNSTLMRSSLHSPNLSARPMSFQSHEAPHTNS